MTQQDRLFAFIQSLTRAEKSYFTKYARLNAAKEKPDYLLLFEYLSEARRYDETELKKHFKREKFIKQLPRKKTQLKEKIIESLSHYHANHTVEASLRLQMNVLPALYEKASKNKILIKEFEKQIKDIKKAAEKHECFSVLIELFEWEWWLLKLLDNNNREKKVFSLLDERKAVKAKLSREVDLKDKATRAQMITLKDPRLREDLNRKKVEDLSISLLEQDEIDSLSKLAKRDYYILEDVYHLNQGKWDLSHKSAHNLISTYDLEQDTLDTIGLIKYKQHLCRYLLISGTARKFDNYLNVIDKLIAVSNDDIKIFNTVQFKLLTHYINTDRFELALDTVKNIESKWDELDKIIPRRRKLAYHYNILIAYWFSGNLNEAIYRLSEVFNFENRPTGQRYVNSSRIIQLPLFYEYKDENLDNRIESARKTLHNKGELNEYRKIIISHFRKIIRCVSKREAKQCIRDMQDKLIRIQEEQNILASDLGCVLLWCERKMSEEKRVVKNAY